MHANATNTVPRSRVGVAVKCGPFARGVCATYTGTERRGAVWWQRGDFTGIPNLRLIKVFFTYQIPLFCGINTTSLTDPREVPGRGPRGSQEGAMGSDVGPQGPERVWKGSGWVSDRHRSAQEVKTAHVGGQIS